MSWSTWSGLLLICLLGAMSPGPSLAMVTRHALAGGKRNGFAIAWAHAAGVGMYALLTMFGLAVLLHQSPRLFMVLTLLGAAYLAYLGLRALMSQGGIAQTLEAGNPVSAAQAARDGLMISLLNPKLALFFIALFSQFVQPGSDTLAHFTLVATPFVIDGLWYTLVTLLLVHPAVLEKLRAKSRLIDRLSGVVLILLAVRVFVTALT